MLQTLLNGSYTFLSVLILPGNFVVHHEDYHMNDGILILITCLLYNVLMMWREITISSLLVPVFCRFKDEVECDRIVLRAFLTPHLVTSFRAAKPDYHQQLLQEDGGAGGEGPDGGGHGRKSFSSGTKNAAQVKFLTVSSKSETVSDGATKTLLLNIEKAHLSQ